MSIKTLNTNLTKVLTFAISMSYNFFTASFICGLLALISTIKTSVLLSSIFFIADSVVRGCLTMANWSSLFILGADLFGNIGFLASLSVFGRWKCTDVRIFFFCLACGPFRTAFLAFKAEALALSLALPAVKKRK